MNQLELLKIRLEKRAATKTRAKYASVPKLTSYRVDRIVRVIDSYKEQAIKRGQEDFSFVLENIKRTVLETEY